MISKSEFNCLFNPLEKKLYQIFAKTEQVNFATFPKSFSRLFFSSFSKKTEGGTFRSESIVAPKVRREPDVMIESEIGGEKGPVDARMNVRERPK